jgi:hypothetical protein
VDDLVRTFSVAEPGATTGFRLKPAVAPDGSPEIESDTLPLKPPSEPTLTVYEPLWPRTSESDDGLIASVKSRVMTTLTPTLCDMPPLAPVMVMPYVPAGSEAAVLMVRVETPAPPVTVAGANVAVP